MEGRVGDPGLPRRGEVVSERIEGTITLDGLVEGRLPPDPDFPARLGDWVRLMAKMGLKVELEIEGSSFNLLANPVQCSVDRLGGDATSQIRSAVEQLAQAFPDSSEAQLFSTLRSVEYAPSEEIQTVYVLRPDGTVEAQQRSLQATTTPPTPPPSPRERLRVLLGGLAVVAIVFGVSAIFVDYGSMFRSFWHRVVPIDAEAIEVDASRYAAYFEVTARERGEGGQSVRLTLKRTADYPTSDAQLAVAYARQDLTFRDRLALDALARGYVTFEVLGEDGTFLGGSVLRVRRLAEEEETTLVVPVPRDPRPHQIVLTW